MHRWYNTLSILPNYLSLKYATATLLVLPHGACHIVRTPRTSILWKMASYWLLAYGSRCGLWSRSLQMDSTGYGLRHTRGPELSIGLASLLAGLLDLWQCQISGDGRAGKLCLSVPTAHPKLSTLGVPSPNKRSVPPFLGVLPISL